MLRTCGLLLGFLVVPVIMVGWSIAGAQGKKDGPEAKLAEHKITLPKYEPSKAPIAGVVVVGKMAYVSGHIAKDADGKFITGRVGDGLSVAEGKDAARIVGMTLLSALKDKVGSLDRVKRVVKLFGMVNAPAGFKDHPAVINGCSELLIQVFGKENGTAARSAVGMSSLPFNAAVEIEGIFELE